nr:hypothetical protein [uncultured Holophaga sp.]
MSSQQPHLEYVRFTLKDRWLHIGMVVSFLCLAITGMTLKFAKAAWAAQVSHSLGGFKSAGTIHRIAAGVMCLVFLAHLVDLFLLKKRTYGTWKALLLGPNSMIPGPGDLQQLVATSKWFLGLGPRPKYGRYTYWEKFDYFAVFWGMVIIGGTGLMLAFPVACTRYLPGWLLNVATIIHSDEALLATGFIFTIHFFNTHLRPEKFPMDTVIFTGRMSLAELKFDKPAEYEALLAAGHVEQHLARPLAPGLVRLYKVFGFTALGIGVITILLIIYSLIFV